MLTRIEIDGFKTFEEFDLPLEPLSIVAGANASGKSNLFDALQLLSRLAEFDLGSAISEIRGDPAELFRRTAAGDRSRRIRLAVEVLLNPTVRDPWGQIRDLKHTRFRYEVVIERRADERGLERLYVVHESATPIQPSEDTWHRVPGRKPSAFARAYIRYRRVAPLLTTESSAQGPAFSIGQDGTPGRKRPAVAAEATVLSSVTSAEFQHLFALREELRSWRLLQLDPVALRNPVPEPAPQRLAANGWNLAAVLARIQAETATEADPAGELTDLSADLAHLVPGLQGFEVSADEGRRWVVAFRPEDASQFTARVASDGTLRLLALLTALTDPLFGGVTCLEEPENGIHPARVGPLIRYLRSLVTDPAADEASADQPLVQLLLSTHSPVVVSQLEPKEGVFFEVTRRIRDGSVERLTSARTVAAEIRETFDPEDALHTVPHGEVQRYLSHVSHPA